MHRESAREHIVSKSMACERMVVTGCKPDSAGERV